LIDSQSRRSKLRRVLPHSGQRSAVTSRCGAMRPDIPSQLSTGRERTATENYPTEPTSSGYDRQQRCYSKINDTVGLCMTRHPISTLFVFSLVFRICAVLLFSQLLSLF